jgi:hypothetical protein
MPSEGSNKTFRTIVFWAVLVTGWACLLYAYDVMFTVPY